MFLKKTFVSSTFIFLTDPVPMKNKRRGDFASGNNPQPEFSDKGTQSLMKDLTGEIYLLSGVGVGHRHPNANLGKRNLPLQKQNPVKGTEGC